MTTILRTYLSVLLGAIVCSWAAGAVAADPTRTVVQGFVLATDSCQLAPASWSGVCSATVIPIEGQIALRKRGAVQRHRTVIPLSATGSFTERLEPGAYRVRLIEPRVAERTLKRSAYRIYPRQVRIQGRGARGVSSVSQANVFIVAHKTRGVPPLVGVSDGFTKE